MNQSSLKILPVKHGDAFIIDCYMGEHHGVIAVDGGPGSCRVQVIRELEKNDSIDLMVLTHYDDDHIGGIMSFVLKHYNDDCFPVKEMWVNACKNIDFNTNTDLSYNQASALSDTLTSISKKNPNFNWDHIIIEGEKREFPFALIEVVSPTDEVVEKNLNKYISETKSSSVDLSVTQRTNVDLNTSFEKLANRKKSSVNLEIENELINSSSIAFILRCDNLSLLMLGDSYPDNIEKYLRTNGYSEINPLIVDYVKVSHHGSRFNISNSLLDIIRCNNYIVSTNGGQGVSNHPDREAIANILCHSKRAFNETIHLFFNYSKDIIENNGALFLNVGEQDKYNFEIHYNINKLP